MDNIIYVDFNKPTYSPKVEGYFTTSTYLKMCEDILDETDFKDLIDAIQDPKFYDACDEDIQQLVIGYYDVFNSNTKR